VLEAAIILILVIGIIYGLGRVVFDTSVHLHRDPLKSDLDIIEQENYWREDRY
jgi:hypothetical protein